MPFQDTEKLFVFNEVFPRLKDLNVFKDSQPSLDDMAKQLPRYYPPVKLT